KLPNTGCSNVVNVSDDGTIETRSMIYTDYFVKGTQPTTLCPVHVLNGYSTGLSGDAQPALSQPPAPGDVRPPVTAIGTAGVSAPVPPVKGGTVPLPPVTKKRAGFWGKIFGRGGGN